MQPPAACPYHMGCNTVPHTSGSCRYDAALKASRLYTVQIPGMVSEMHVITSHRLLHLPETAGALGHSNAGDSSLHEASHKSTKDAWRRTSRRPGTAVHSVCMKVQHKERVKASLSTLDAPVARDPSPTHAGSTATRVAKSTNTGVGRHPARSLVLPPSGPAGAPPAVGPLPSPSAQLLWAPDSVASSARTVKAQADIVRKALERYYAEAARPPTAFAEASAAPIRLFSGIRLVDSCAGKSSSASHTHRPSGTPFPGTTT